MDEDRQAHARNVVLGHELIADWLWERTVQEAKIRYDFAPVPGREDSLEWYYSRSSAEFKELYRRMEQRTRESWKGILNGRFILKGGTWAIISFHE